MVNHSARASRLLVSCFAMLVTGARGRAIPLVEYAKSHPLVIQTVRPNEEVSIGQENQVNNLKEGGKILVLSDKELTGLDGIATLTVLDDARPVPITKVPQLQLFLNNNRIEVVPDEFA